MAGKRHSNIIQRKEISITHVFWSKKYFFGFCVFLLLLFVIMGLIHTLDHLKPK